MRVRIGLLGAEDVMEIIREGLLKYDEFDCISISCLTEEDLNVKIPPIQEDIDMWLCTGPITYHIVQAWGRITTPIFYVSYHGASLYKTLLQAIYTEKTQIGEISFDGLEGMGLNLRADIEQALREAGIEDQVQFLNSDTFDVQELIEYHYSLWASGKTKVAITGHPIQDELRKRGVPAYRVLPPTMAITSIANQMLRTAEMLFFKKTQIAILMVELNVYEGMTKPLYSSDELHRMELQYTEKLLNYARDIQGSLKTIGPGRYVIFTTRGLLQDMTRDFTVAPEMASTIEKSGRQVMTCGIGIGQTAYEAEMNAGTALLHAKTSGSGSWMVCFDDKRISGPLGSPEQIEFSYASEQLHTISQQTKLSIANLQKIKSVLRKRGSEEIGSNELARYLHMTERSARRILMELEEKGFAQLIAEEKPQTRGRPRKIYRVLF